MVVIVERLAVAAICGVTFGAGVVGAARFGLATPRSETEDEGPGSEPRSRSSPEPGARWGRTLRPRDLAGAAGVAVVAGMVTGWPVAVLLGAAAALGVPRLFGRTSASVTIERVEAVAVWTEMLHGTLAASAGLQEAIVATAPLCPPAIRSATDRLASRLRSGVPTRSALLELADELADPSVDRVVCALLLAVEARAQRLGDLLGALADSTRDEVAMRLRIETGRASVRTGVRTVLVCSLVFAVGLAVLARPYLSHFGSLTGQLVLLIVGALYAAGLTLMVRMSAPGQPVRLLPTRNLDVRTMQERPFGSGRIGIRDPVEVPSR
jgi:tight adherence protein B